MEDKNLNRELLLAEYNELGHCWRHDDQLFSNLTAVLLPISVGGLTLPYLKDGIPKFPVAVGCAILMTFWYLSSLRYERRHRIRYERIHSIERLLGFDSHLKFDEKINTAKWPSFQKLRLVVYLAYIITLVTTLIFY